MSAKVLTLDIETTPALAASFSQWKQNLTNDKIVYWDKMTAIGAKWLDRKGTLFFSEYDAEKDEITPQKKLEMVFNTRELLDEADVVVHYNGTTFDTPWIYREIAEAGLTPPSPFREIDLFKTAKRFRFFSHKLQHVSTRLGMAGKHDAGGMTTWLQVMSADPVLAPLLADYRQDAAKAWKRFERYCRRDVVQAEELYLELRPWVKSHPNMQLYDIDPTARVCPKCGATEGIQARGYAYTALSRFRQYHCTGESGCGGWFRGKNRLDGVDMRGVS